MYSDTIEPGSAHAGQFRVAPTNIIGTGQHGYITKLSEYNKGYAYVRRSVIPVVISLPRMFDELNDPEVWYATGKEMLETGCKEISGLNATLSHQHVETQLNRASSMMHTPGKSTIAQSNVNTVITEKDGQPNSRYLEAWISLGLDDPNTGRPGIAALVDDSVTLRLTPSFVSATVMYIEPDPFHREVVRAWLMLNMMPKSAGTIEGKYDEFNSRDPLDLSIDWTGFHHMGDAVDQYAQELLRESSIAGAVASREALWINGKDGAVEDANLAGYNATINQIRDGQI
tara:strand:+ start:202733 stop:203590 length:858 start_codon:yes stop_codon:yes gene_type:complete